MNSSELPARVELVEEGSWKKHAWSSSPYDDQWISTGWRVRTYDGTVVFRHDKKGQVLGWLDEYVYTNTGDGVHFTKG